MIEVTLTPITGRALMRLIDWSLDAAPAANRPSVGDVLRLGDARIAGIEPGQWLVSCPQGSVVSAAQIFAGTDTAIVDVSGSLTGIRIAGAGWRDLLMIGGVFDAEDPAFTSGRVARTVMHHAPLLIDVVGDDAAEAWIPASYAGEVLATWRKAAARLTAAPPR